MKIRTDYVSNSSSSSFIIEGEDAKKAAKMFLEDFADCLVGSYETLGESMNVGVLTSKNASDEYWMDWKSPESFAEEYTQGEYDYKANAHKEPANPDDIVKFGFECDDWDKGSLGYLAFLFRYFKKFGFTPDDSDSEHPFNKDQNSFLVRILNRIDFNDVVDNLKKEKDKDEDSR